MLIKTGILNTYYLAEMFQSSLIENYMQK